jgi:hypothetical protein
MAIPALPSAVERAYIVLPHAGSCLVSAFHDEEDLKGCCLRMNNVQFPEPTDTRRGRRRVQLPPYCFKSVRMLLLAPQTAFRLIDLDNAYVSLLLRRGYKDSVQFRIVMPRILGNNVLPPKFQKRFQILKYIVLHATTKFAAVFVKTQRR